MNVHSLNLRDLATVLNGEIDGQQVRAPGPNHSAKDRSLCVKIVPQAQDGFIVHSFAGDDPLSCKDHVRQRAGLPAWEPFKYGATSKVAAEYIYNDEGGRPYLRVVRTRDKNFWQSRRQGVGWENGKPSGSKIPYRLPELIAAVHDDVFVVEGEKDADALCARGFIATCNSEGAGKWTSDLNKWFFGKRVFVLADNDEVGAKHALEVAENLAALAKEVRIIALPGLPPKGDVSDWLATGGQASNLLSLCLSFPLYSTTPATASDGWPVPKDIVSPLPPVEPFIAELLPVAIRDYVLDVADRQQAPPDFAAVAALCGLAALAGNNVRIRPKQFDDWEVVPNLWGAIVGRPSSMKSPALRAALAPIYAIQDAMRTEWEAAQRCADVDDVLSSLDAKEKKKRAAIALKCGDRDEAKRLLAEKSSEGEDEIPCPRLTVNDSTVEKLGELLNENPRGLLLIRDELPGFLARMESDECQSERAFYLEAFNGDGQFTYDRIGRGTVHIPNCTLSIIGGVQPSRIAPLVRGAMTGTSDDGLIQRLQMTVWPDDVMSWKWTDRSPNAVARAKYDAAFSDLHNFTRKLTAPAVFGFSDAAQDVFKEWMISIQAEARTGKLPSILESHILKMPKTVASLALLFELVDGGRGTVGRAATLRALEWGEYLRSHANRLYAAGGVVAEDGARLILERRLQLPEAFTARDVQRKAWGGLADWDAVGAAIDLLTGAGYCRETAPMPSSSGGRPSVTYIWNPHIKAEG